MGGVRGTQPVDLTATPLLDLCAGHHAVALDVELPVAHGDRGNAFDGRRSAMDRGDARPTRWILYRHTYDASRGRDIDLPFSGHKTERDAVASIYVADVELQGLQARNELAVDDEYDHLEPVTPIPTAELVRTGRIASRAFRRGADVLTVLQLLDLPLQDSSFMIGPWPPSRPPAAPPPEQT